MPYDGFSYYEPDGTTVRISWWEPWAGAPESFRQYGPIIKEPPLRPLDFDLDKPKKRNLFDTDLDDWRRP